MYVQHVTFKCMYNSSVNFTFKCMYNSSVNFTFKCMYNMFHIQTIFGRKYVYMMDS